MAPSPILIVEAIAQKLLLTAQPPHSQYPVFLLERRVRVQQWLRQNAINSSLDVLSQAYSDVLPLAEECGIHWDRLSRELPQPHQPLTGSAVPVCSRADRWTSFFIWFDNRSYGGIDFPVLVFLTHRRGGIKNVFNGHRWLVEQSRAASRLRLRQAPRAALGSADSRAVQPEDWRRARFSVFHRQFQQLPQEWGTHPYLQRKLGNWAPAICSRMNLRRGLDSRGDFIATPLYGTEGVVGYQRIYDRAIGENGRDREYVLRAQRAKRGAYAYISGLESTSSTGLVEGVATGMSVALCRSCPIYIALDAGNMPFVAEGLQCGQLEVFADNDCWKPAVGNVGTAKAREAIQRQGHGQLFVPRFRDEFSNMRPTDFNDLLSLEGLRALQVQLACGGEVAGG